MSALLEYPSILDSIKTPFNRIDIFAGLAFILPNLSYDINDIKSGAFIILLIDNIRYTVPVNIFVSYPKELLECVNFTKLKTVIRNKINNRFKAMELSIVIEDIIAPHLGF